MISTGVGFTFLVTGTLFAVIGSIGVTRLPDFYTRAHAASKPDTLGLVLSMLGLAILEGPTLNSLKMLLILLFVSLANPAATHALGRAALRSGLEPWARPRNEADALEDPK